MIEALTPAFISSKAVCPPNKKRVEFCDSNVRGLLLECRSAAGSVPTWYWRHKVDGHTKYHRLGSVHDLDLDQARKQVNLLKAEHAMKSPSGDKDEVGTMSLDTFMKLHYMPHAEMHKRSHKRDDQLYRLRIAPKFGHVSLKEISRHQIQAFHIALIKDEELSPASADLHVALLRHALNLAVEWEMVEKNVLKGFKLFLVDNRVDNHLEREKVECLKDVLLTDNNRPVCLILLFLLVVGTRLGSALNARWKDFDLDNAVWVVPPADAKSKRANPHWLNPSALWVLKEIGTRGNSEFVFPNPETGKPYTTITRVWYRLRKKAGLNDKVRIHDLRHTFAHMLLEAGRGLFEVQKALNHADARTTMTYAHVSAKTMHDAARAASVIVKEPVVQLEAQAG